MTAATREQVMAALLTRLQGTGQFTVVTRRNAAPETIATPGQPALVLVKHHERYEKKSTTLKPVRVMIVLAIIYIDVGAVANAIPDAILNPIQDAIDTALNPDSAQYNTCTLGGLVQSTVIVGEVISAPGDKTGKGTVIIPIEITLP